MTAAASREKPLSIGAFEYDNCETGVAPRFRVGQWFLKCALKSCRDGAETFLRRIQSPQSTD